MSAKPVVAFPVIDNKSEVDRIGNSVNSNTQCALPEIASLGRTADGLSRRHRVDGVPFFVINGKITLGGAQPPEAFLAAFDQAGGSK